MINRVRRRKNQDTEGVCVLKGEIDSESGDAEGGLRRKGGNREGERRRKRIETEKGE